MTFTNGDILRAEELNAMLDDIESLKLQVLAALGKSSEISVTTFGAVGGGVANDRTAFSTAHSTVDPSRAIYVPAGTYNLGVEDLITDARRWIFGGTVTFTAGRLRQSLFEIHNSTSGTIDEFYDPGALFWLNRTRRMGGARQNPAFNLGSADPESPHGTAFFADGHPNFVALQPDDPYNPVEINLYNYCTVGRGTSVVGTNQITRNLSAWSASMPFLPEFIGKCLYWNGIKYKVLTVPNQNTVTVSLMNGTAVSFTSAITKTYHFTYTIFRSVVNVSGTAVTRVKGHRFFDYLVTALNNPTSVIVINGTQYSVESVTDADHLTLTSSAGTLTNASATAYAEIDGETTALRLNHAILGEQLTIMTSAGSQDGLGAAYLFKEDKGAGDWYPMVFQIAGRDGLAVANDLTTGKTFIGVGDGRRKPTCELDVNGMIRNSHLSLRQNSIERHDEDTDGTVVAINYSGYAGGNTRTRDLEIYDGKGNLTARFDGAAGGHSYLKKIPACLLRCTSAPTFPQGAGTTITWDTEEHDSNGMHVPGSSVVTVPVSGVYRICASYEINGTGDAANSNIITAIYILKNGTAAAASGFTRHRVAGGAAAGVGHTYSRDMALNANDTIAIQGYYGGQAGTTATLDNSFAYTSLSVTLVTAI